MNSWRRVFRSISLCLTMLAAVLLAAGCSASAGAGALRSESAPTALTVRVLDIGQGDAILLEKGGQWALIDSGDVEKRDALAGYLKKYGVKKLNAVLITHPHADHLGGMYAVFRTAEVGHIYDDGQPATTSTYRNYLKEIKKRNIPYTAVKAGDSIPFFQEVSFRVMGPVEIRKDKKGRPEMNNNSVAGRLEYGRFSMMFTGDAEKEEEMDMVRTYAGSLRSDILKVGHHGSKTSSSAPFLKAVSPKAAVLSAGAGNSYGLPHDITLKKLDKLNVSLYRTDRDGTVTIESDGVKYTIKKEH